MTARTISYLNGSEFQDGQGPNTVGVTKIRDIIDTLQKRTPAPFVTNPEYGAIGNGVADDAPAFTTAIAAGSPQMPAGTYHFTTGVTLPFAGALIGWPGSAIDGTLTSNGARIQFGNNPANQTTWATAVNYNYEALSVDLGGYGVRSFSAKGCPTAINGSIVIPASTDANIYNGFGVSGYVKNSATTTSGVALYGEGNVQATGAKVWGINTRSIDNGYAASNAIWGAEFDCDIGNVGSVVYGVHIVGGSTVEPTLSQAIRIDPIGIYATPKKRWQSGVLVNDGSCVTGIEVGTDVAGAQANSMPLRFYYNTAAPARTLGGTIVCDNAGNFTFTADSSGLAVFRSGANNNIQCSGANIGFFNHAPAAKPTVSGAKGGNAALASLLTGLAGLGLITDSSGA